MADWTHLVAALRGTSGRTTFSWSELEDLVGSLPPSATNHRAWWSGDRPHTRTWERAGIRLSSIELGRRVTFERHAADLTWDRAELDVPPRKAPAAAADETSILLITCVKTKLDHPAAAKDLYVSPLFKRARRYAEASAAPWFILSAEHGLLQPDQWLAPYERYLPDTPETYRQAWGRWVVERLALVAGPLDGRTVEVHASALYLAAIRETLTEHGAQVLEPLQGLDRGKRLTWYDAATPSDIAAPTRSAADFVGLLSDRSAAVSPTEFRVSDRSILSVPGLYSWWADTRGAADLTDGLGHPVAPGLIYAGLAGATRWPSGKRSTNTLWSRIAGMHLGKRHEFSTFRRTLGSVLAAKNRVTSIDEVALTEWMDAHLRVVAVPCDDPDTLGRLESDVLATLDPPLNLQGMPPSPVRRRLTELRRSHSRA